MPPDERDWLPPRDPTSRLWDEFLAGEPSGMEGAGREPTGASRSGPPDDPDASIAETIRRFHALDDAPAPDAALTERIWQAALARSGVAGAMPAANGHHPRVELAATADLAGGMTAGRRSPITPAAGVRRRSRGIVREVGIAILAGAIAGFFALGGGARLIMYLLAAMADPSVQGRLTENGERVGEVTFGGTLALMLVGAAVGAMGGVFFALIRPWLPWSGWRRGALFGLLLAVTFGSLALEGGNNPDYRRFGVPFLNVCLFNFLPVAFGLVVVPIAEWLDRRPPTRFSRSEWWRASGVAVDVLVVLFILPVVVFSLPAIIGASPIGLSAVGLVLGRAAIVRWVGRFDRPSDLLARPAAFAAAYAILALPTVAGLYLTLRAAGRILGAG